MNPKHVFYEASGLRLHALDYGGSGRPIICLHGVTAHAWVWSAVAEPMVSVGHVVAMDLRGFGDSQWSADAEYTTDDHVRDLGSLVTTLGADEVDLVGASWGGLVAIAYAAGNPARVHRVALVDVEPASAMAEDSVPLMDYDFASFEEVLAAERAANPHAPDDMIEIAASFGTRPGEAGRFYRKRDPYFLQRWPFRADDRWTELSSLGVPTLVVHAANSFIPADVAERMAKEAARGTLVEIADSGHVVPIENPHDLAEALVAFLSG